MELLSLFWQHCQHIALKQVNVMEKKMLYKTFLIQACFREAVVMLFMV